MRDHMIVAYKYEPPEDFYPRQPLKPVEVYGIRFVTRKELETSGVAKKYRDNLIRQAMNHYEDFAGMKPAAVGRALEFAVYQISDKEHNLASWPQYIGSLELWIWP